MKLYIAGKITGNPDYKNEFADVAKTYRKKGDIILNPAELPEGMRPEDYMRICFAMIDSADAVVFLPTWACSEGAALEYQYCRYIGKPIRYANAERYQHAK